MYAYMSFMCITLYRYSQRSKGIRYPGTGAMKYCESPDMNAEN